MNRLEELDVFDCPICGGPGLLQEENGWCVYVECLDCGSHTAELSFRTPEERLEMAKKATSTWNLGKVIRSTPGE